MDENYSTVNQIIIACKNRLILGQPPLFHPSVTLQQDNNHKNNTQLFTLIAVHWVFAFFVFCHSKVMFAK